MQQTLSHARYVGSSTDVTETFERKKWVKTEEENNLSKQNFFSLDITY